MSEAAETAEKKKRPFDTYDVVVEKSVDLTPRNKEILFRLPAGKNMDFKAGQFVQLFIPLPDGKTRRTSYSIASSPTHRDCFELCVTLVDGGVSSTYLHKLKPGDKLQAMGPLGKFTMVDDQRDAVFICTGSGVAPFRSMIHDRLEKGTRQNLWLLFGNRYEGDVIYQKEWDDLAKRHGQFHRYFTLSRATWDGPKGYVQDHVQKFLPDVKDKDFYICGLNNMITAVQDRLLSLGVPMERIHYERYD